MSNKHYLEYTVTQLEEAIGKVLNGELNVPLQAKTVIPSVKQQIVLPDSNYKGLSKVTVEAVPQSDSVTPTFSVTPDGIVTVTIQQKEGYFLGGTKTFNYQLPTDSGGEYENDAQTIAIKGKYMTGDIVIVEKEPTFSVASISGASYGFTLNNDGYYQSGNKGVHYSYAICRVNFNVPTATTVYFDCINYAEANYDYGLIGLIDTPLALNYYADTSVTKSFKNSSGSTIVQTVSITIPAGTHFVDVKFIKDDSQSSNNDTLLFKVRFA